MNIRPVLNPGLPSPWDTLPSNDAIGSCQDKEWLHNELRDYDEFLREAEAREERYQGATCRHQVGEFLSLGVAMTSLVALTRIHQVVNPGLRTALYVAAAATSGLAGISTLHQGRLASDSQLELDSSGRDIAGLWQWKNKVRDRLHTLGEEYH